MVQMSNHVSHWQQGPTVATCYIVHTTEMSVRARVVCRAIARLSYGKLHIHLIEIKAYEQVKGLMQVYL